MKVRDPYFDLIKFAAIFTVVFSHVLTALLSWGPICIKNFIIGWNMPLFFLISGYFARNLISSKSIPALTIRIASLLWSALLWSIFLKMPAVFIKHGGNFLDGVSNSISCFRGFWFLWVLADSFVVTFFAVRLFEGKCGRVFFVFFCYLASMFLPWSDCNPLLIHIDNFRHMFPYFLIGYMWMEKLLRLKNGMLGGVAFCVMLVLAFVQGDIRVNELGFYWSHLSFFDAYVDFPHWLFFAVSRWGIGIVGCIGIMWLVCKLAQIPFINVKLACLGTTTLGVYIMHQDILRMGGALFVCIPSTAISFAVPAITVALFLGCHYAVRFSQINKVFSAFVWNLPKHVWRRFE